MEKRLHREPVRLRTGILVPGAHDPGHRDRRQAERAADHRRRVPGCIGGQDRPVTIPPRSLDPPRLERTAFPLGQPAPDTVRDPVTEGVLQARLADRARCADQPGGVGLLAALGIEHAQVRAAARSPLPPARDETGRKEETVHAGNPGVQTWKACWEDSGRSRPSATVRERPSDEQSDNRHRQRQTPVDMHGRSAAGHGCCRAGRPRRNLASGRRGRLIAESGRIRTDDGAKHSQARRSLSCRSCRVSVRRPCSDPSLVSPEAPVGLYGYGCS